MENWTDHVESMLNDLSEGSVVTKNNAIVRVLRVMMSELLRLQAKDANRDSEIAELRKFVHVTQPWPCTSDPT